MLFGLISNKRVFFLPISFPILGLAKLGVKPRLSNPRGKCFRFIPGSRSVVPFSCQSVAHVNFLPSHDLVIWIDGSVRFSF